MSSSSLGVSAEKNCVTAEKFSDDFGVSAENSLWRASLLIIDRCSRSRSVSGLEAQSCRSLVAELGSRSLSLQRLPESQSWLKGSLWDRSPSMGSWGVCLCQFSFCLLHSIICSCIPRTSRFMLCQLVLGWVWSCK